MKKYVYNVFEGSYDTPVFITQIALSVYIGQSYVTRTSNTWVFVKEVEADEP